MPPHDGKLTRRTALALAGAAPFAMAYSRLAAQTEPYPSREIHIICGFPAGSGADVWVRFFVDQIRPMVPKPIIVENKVGANGHLGNQAAMDANAERVIAHISGVGMAAELPLLNRRFSAERLIGHMRRDKKVRDGALHFVLARGIGQAFTSADVPVEAVTELLRDEGCAA